MQSSGGGVFTQGENVVDVIDNDCALETSVDW